MGFLKGSWLPLSHRPCEFISHRWYYKGASAQSARRGPEGGEGGGQAIAVGSPEAVAKKKDSATGYFLKKILDKDKKKKAWVWIPLSKIKDFDSPARGEYEFGSET
jgi:hypothetical protein